MNLRLTFVLLTLCLLGMVGCQVVQPNPNNAPQAESGVLRLSAWDFEQDGPIALRGEWEFYWEQLLTPQDFQQASPPQQTGYVTLPKSWTNHQLEGRTFPDEGYATYRLRVPIQSSQDALTLKMDIIRTAHRLFVNGQEIGSNGQVGNQAVTTTPRYAPYNASVMSPGDELEIILQVANFHRDAGGPWTDILLGRDDELIALRENGIAVNLFLFGSLLIMGLYHIGLFTIRRQDQSTLYFGLFSCLIALRMLVTGEMYFVRLFPMVNWATIVRIDILTVYIGLPIFAMFCHELYQQEFSKRILRLVQIISMGLAAIAVVTSPRIFTETISFFEIVVLFLAVYLIIVIIQAIRHQRDSARIFMAGFIILLLSVINDLLHENQLIQTGYFIPFGLFGFIFTQTLILSIRFSRAFTRVETLLLERASLQDQLEAHNRTLETQVQHRTDDLAQEVREHQKAVIALWESEAKNRALLQAIPDLIFVLDASGVYLETHGHLDSYDHPSVGGKQLHDLLPPELADRIQQAITQTLQNQTMTQIFYEIDVETGQRYLDTRLVPLNANKVLMIVRDVTSQRQVETQLQETNQQLSDTNIILKEHNAELDAFARTVAHDISNPISAIVSYASFIRELSDNMTVEDISEKLEVIEEAGQKTANIVRELLLLAGVRGQTITPEPFQMSQVIDQVVQRLAFMIREYEGEVSYPDEWPVAVGYGPWIEEVWANYISNGLKYCGDHPELELGATCQPDGMIRFWVRDNGPGIAPEKQANLFIEFTRLNEVKADGHGLGLSIVRRIIDKLGGQVGVESELGQGSLFYFTLPAADEGKK